MCWSYLDPVIHHVQDVVLPYLFALMRQFDSKTDIHLSKLLHVIERKLVNGVIPGMDIMVWVIECTFHYKRWGVAVLAPRSVIWHYWHTKVSLIVKAYENRPSYHCMHNHIQFQRKGYQHRYRPISWWSLSPIKGVQSGYFVHRAACGYVYLQVDVIGGNTKDLTISTDVTSHVILHHSNNILASFVICFGHILTSQQSTLFSAVPVELNGTFGFKSIVNETAECF